MPHDQDMQRLQDQLIALRMQVLHAGKRDALGMLAPGLTHELSNPIGFIKNNLLILEEYLNTLLPSVELLINTLATDPQAIPSRAQLEQAFLDTNLRPILDDIAPLLIDTRAGVQRLEELVASLRTVSRPDNPAGEPFDLNQCVRDVLKVATYELKYKAQVSTTLGELPFLNGKPGEISQVILNLLINAAQALTQFGEIRLSTACVDDTVCLCIADTGPGICEAHLKDLFTPLFSTKPLDQGSGLGLSISRDIIEAHGGRIEVQTASTVGCEFRIFLPCPQ